jgi:hypothetical protein
MNDDERDQKDPGNENRPSEFTRFFQGDRPDSAKTGPPALEETPPAATGAGEFTRMFSEPGAREGRPESTVNDARAARPGVPEIPPGPVQPAPTGGPAVQQPVGEGEFTRSYREASASAASTNMAPSKTAPSGTHSSGAQLSNLTSTSGTSPAPKGKSRRRERLTDKFPLIAGAQPPPDPLRPEPAPTSSERAPSQEELQKAFAHPLAPDPPRAMEIAARRAASVDVEQPEGFTKLFNPAPAAGQSPPLNTGKYPMGEVSMGPSEFTRVINSSELRAAGQQSLAAGASAGGLAPAPPAAAPQPAMPQYPFPPAPHYQIPPQAPLPQYPPPQMPVPQAYFPPAPQVTPPASQAPQAAAQSKWIAYLPVIIVINVLFMLAVLLVLFIALRK